MDSNAPMQPTRWEILRILKHRGKATVDELSKALGLTLMGVRLHLVVLERDGLVSRASLRSGPGRPALVYSLTERAEDVFPKRYEQLASLLLDAFVETNGHSGAPVWEAAASKLVESHRGRVTGTTLGARVQEVSTLLDDEGCFASWEEGAEGYLIHEHNCPYYRVAKSHPDVCELDHFYLQALLGAEVEQRACLLHGDGRCTYLVRPPNGDGAEASH